MHQKTKAGQLGPSEPVAVNTFDEKERNQRKTNRGPKKTKRKKKEQNLAEWPVDLPLFLMNILPCLTDITSAFLSLAQLASSERRKFHCFCDP